MSKVAETFLQDVPLPPHTPHWSFVLAELRIPSQPTLRGDGVSPLARFLLSSSADVFVMTARGALLITVGGVVVTGTQDPFMHHCNVMNITNNKTVLKSF